MSTGEITAAEETGAAPLLGSVISGRYRVEKLLGEGGMGAVYLAEHTHMRKRVALKLLHAEMSQNPEVLARFEREARAAARIEHPNVAAATDFGRTEDGSFFLVLEYVEGESLRQVLDRGPLAADRAIRVARQMASALARAHEAGIVHRDLKPENIMLVRRGEDPDFVKVLDFGIAKDQAPETTRDGAAAQPLTRMGTILGTPEYMAPEQALGEPVTPQSDLYAVGVMLYEMLTGLHPFEATDRMAILSFHIVAPVPLMRDRAPAVDVPAVIEAVTRKLLEKDAKARPESARALVAELDAAAAALGVVPAPTSVEALPTSTPALPSAPPSTTTGALPVAEGPGSTPWAAEDSFARTDHGEAVPPSLIAAATAKTRLEARTARERGAPPLAAAIAAFRAWPRPLQLGVAAAPVVGFLLVLLAALALRDPKAGDPHASGGSEPASESSAASARLPPRATEETLRSAGKDAAAIEALAKQFPEDPAVFRALAFAYQAQGRAAEALRAVRASLEKRASGAPRPSAEDERADAELVQLVVDVATRGKGEDDDEAFAILEGPLGARGVDALLEMSTLAAGPRANVARTRAKASLAKAEVRANATPAAGVLLDFRAAKDCVRKRELLGRAGSDGDARLLATLRPMRATRGCGFAGLRDCWPCLRDTAQLDEAIASIERRAPAEPAGSGTAPPEPRRPRR